MLIESKQKIILSRCPPPSSGGSKSAGSNPAPEVNSMQDAGRMCSRELRHVARQNVAQQNECGNRKYPREKC